MTSVKVTSTVFDNFKTNPKSKEDGQIDDGLSIVEQ
jgi:hypothetical protein